MLDKSAATSPPALHAALHLCVHGHTHGPAIPEVLRDGFVPWRLERGMQLCEEEQVDMLCNDWRGLELLGDLYTYDHPPGQQGW